MASASLPTFSLVMPATEIRPSLVAYTECFLASVSLSNCVSHWLDFLCSNQMAQGPLRVLHLLRRQAGVGEHADLAGDVRPVMLGAELL